MLKLLVGDAHHADIHEFLHDGALRLCDVREIYPGVHRDDLFKAVGVAAAIVAQRLLLADIAEKPRGRHTAEDHRENHAGVTVGHLRSLEVHAQDSLLHFNVLLSAENILLEYAGLRRGYADTAA